MTTCAGGSATFLASDLMHQMPLPAALLLSRFRPDMPCTLPGASRPAPRPSPLAPHTLVAPLSGDAGLVGPSSSIDDTLSCLYGEAGFCLGPAARGAGASAPAAETQPGLVRARLCSCAAADAGVRSTAALPLQTPAATTTL